MDCSLPGSSVRGVLQARIREWVAMPFFGVLPDPGIEPGSPTLHAEGGWKTGQKKQPLPLLLSFLMASSFFGFCFMYFVVLFFTLTPWVGF